MAAAIKIKTQDVVESGDKVTCGICQRQFARYTCPKCNLAYCSLICYRSESHSQCSEGFYKTEIQADIQKMPSKSKEERVRMMEVLQRFERDVAALEDEDSSSDELGSDLAARFKDVDLDAVSSDSLWSMLNETERASFLKMMRDPSRSDTQDLLSSEFLARQRRVPWWERADTDLPQESGSDSTEQPKMMKISSNLQLKFSQTRPLIYNVLFLCLAYAHTVRSLSVRSLSSLAKDDPDTSAAQHLIAQSAPFLMDARSTTLHTTASEVVTALWSRIDKPTPVYLTLLLRDAEQFLRPSPATQLPSNDDPDNALHQHPHALALLFLSDIYHFTKITHARRKLEFYAAYLVALASPVLTVTLVEISAEVQKQQRSAEELVEVSSADVERLPVQASKSRIEEL